MGADKEIIVAIELGSSTIRGIAGQKGHDGNMKILAKETIEMKECVRRGIIFNIDKTSRTIRLIKESLEEKLDVIIKRAYVGLSGQSLHTVSNKIVHNLAEYVKITSNHTDSLLDENHGTEYPKRKILETIPQEYLVDGTRTNEPEGIQGYQIEGNFLNIIALSTLEDNIRKCCREAGLEVAELLISPLELAKHLIPDSEKRAGCALVDMGADTTTVSVYCDNILRHLVVIPLGGRNITKDICSVCTVENNEAENLKKKQTIAYVSFDSDPEDNKQSVALSNDRVYSQTGLQDIVSARTEEIIRNVGQQIDNSGWNDKLLSGIILTGGASKHDGMLDAYRNLLHIDKIKIACALAESTTANAGVVANDDIMLNTLIALLLSGTQNCVSEKFDNTEDAINEPILDEPNDAEPTAGAEKEEEEEPRERKPKKNWWQSLKKGIEGMLGDEE